MGESGKAIGCLLMLIILAAVAGGGWFWWNSPARKLQGEWIVTGGALPVNMTLNFKSGGVYTATTQVGGGGILASSGESTGTYKVNSSAKPPVLEMTTVSGSGFGAGVKPVSLPYQFIDSDTLQLETPGVVAFKLVLKRKK